MNRGNVFPNYGRRRSNLFFCPQFDDSKYIAFLINRPSKGWVVLRRSLIFRYDLVKQGQLGIDGLTSFTSIETIKTTRQAFETFHLTGSLAIYKPNRVQNLASCDPLNEIHEITNMTTVDTTHGFFELPHASSINHVCVFLLGTQPFPDGYGAAVHFFWPGKGFQLLGMISNEKPSAIFRLRGNFSSSSAQNTNAQNVFSQQSGTQDGSDVTAILGLAMEPLDSIQAQLTNLPANQANPDMSTALTKVPTPSDAVILAERVVKHLFNYLSGFTGGTPNGRDVVIPMSVIVRWYETLVNKLKTTGIGFLERQE